MKTKTREQRREELRAKFQAITDDRKEEFRSVIQKERDDELLADLRYDFGWDPDPRKSSWKTIAINRLLKKRQKRREALPVWIGIIIANLLALGSLIVSLLKPT